MVSILTSNLINKFERKISGKGAVRAGKGFTLFILNEDMNDIIKIIKLLEYSAVFIDRVTETVKHKIKKEKRGFFRDFLVPLAFSIVQPVFSSVLKGISGRGVRRTGRKYMNKKFSFPVHPLSNIEITEYFNYEPRFNNVFSRNNLPRIKDRVYVINLDDQKSKGTHWVSLFIDKHLDVYFDSF